MNENSACATFFVCATVIALFCSGSPDLIDAMIYHLAPDLVKEK